MMAFQWLLRYWLQNVAQEKIRETVLNAAKERIHAAASNADQLVLRPCDVGLVFALEMEWGGLHDRLDEPMNIRGHRFRLVQGRLKGRNLVLIRSGMGAPAAAEAAQTLVDGHRPAWVISAGFAGGLSDALPRGDLVVADALLSVSGDRLPVDLRAVPRELLDLGAVHVGPELTVDRIISLAEEKRALGRQFGALALDMESYAVGQVCARHGVPFLAVRVITDTVDDNLPRDLERLMSQKSNAARLGTALGTLMNRPGSLKDLVSLRQSALAATDRLAKFLRRLIVALRPERDEP